MEVVIGVGISCSSESGERNPCLLAQTVIKHLDSTVTSQKLIGSVPSKLQRVFDLVENVDLYNVSITVEAGLGTIFAAAEYNSDVLSGANVFDDTIPLNMDGFYKTNNESLEGAAVDIRENYNTVASQFVNFAQNVRKDHITIRDPKSLTP